MKGSFVRNTLAACTLAFAAAGAQAAIVTQWDYSITLAWEDADFSGGSGEQTTNSTELSWGSSAPGASHTIPQSNNSLNRSALIIDTPNTVTGTVNTYINEDLSNPPASYFVPSGTITHYNNVLNGNFATLKTATLGVTVTLTPQLPAPEPSLDPFSYTFDIKFIETSNSSPCGFPSSSICDDIFVIDFGSLNQEFTHPEPDGQTYYVSIIGLLGSSNAPLAPLDAATCEAAGASAGCIGFQTLESQQNAADFLFAITTKPVTVCEGDDCNPTIPEPGTLVLMGLGLVGLRSLRRRS